MPHPAKVALVRLLRLLVQVLEYVDEVIPVLQPYGVGLVDYGYLDRAEEVKVLLLRSVRGQRNGTKV